MIRGFYRAASWATVAIALSGCGIGVSEQSSKQPILEVDPFTIEGPNGKLALGDPISKAVEVYPAPKDAYIHSASSLFGDAFEESAAWTSAEVGKEGFEVASESDRIAALAVVVSPPLEHAMRSSINTFGEPDVHEKGEYSEVAAWIEDGVARVVIVANVLELSGDGAEPTLREYRLDLLSDVESLAKVGFDVQDPEAIVELLDFQVNEMRRVTEAN